MFITVVNNFEGFHCRPDAPEVVGFLRNIHRHIFYAKTSLPVTKEDRELEFFMVQATIDTVIKEMQTKLTESKSCEAMARYIANEMLRIYGVERARVEISEDNENSATVEVTNLVSK